MKRFGLWGFDKRWDGNDAQGADAHAQGQARTTIMHCAPDLGSDMADAFKTVFGVFRFYIVFHDL